MHTKLQIKRKIFNNQTLTRQTGLGDPSCENIINFVHNVVNTRGQLGQSLPSEWPTLTVTRARVGQLRIIKFKKGTNRPANKQTVYHSLFKYILVNGWPVSPRDHLLVKYFQWATPTAGHNLWLVNWKENVSFYALIYSPIFLWSC